MISPLSPLAPDSRQANLPSQPLFPLNKRSTQRAQRDSVRFAGVDLTAEEKRLLANMATAAERSNLIIFTDPGFDVDDQAALVVASSLHKRGYIDIKAVVGTTVPSFERALLAKGVLKELGLGDVPVAVGSNHQPQGFNPESHRLQVSFLPKPEEVEPDAQALLRKTLEEAEDNSITLLLIANMGDAAELLKSDEALFRQKVKKIVLMGGVEQTSDDADTGAEGIKLNTDGLLVANKVATNNKHNQAAADFLYHKAQELEIPIKVVTRKAATNTPVDREIFAEMAKSGNPVAQHIRQIEGEFLNKFWQAAYHQKMGPERDKEWFKRSFCKPDTPDTLTDQDDIRPYLKNRVKYDAIALLACVDELANQWFDPLKIKVRNTVHQIIGLSDKAHGLLNPTGLAKLLSALSKDGLRAE